MKNDIPVCCWAEKLGEAPEAVISTGNVKVSPDLCSVCCVNTSFMDSIEPFVGGQGQALQLVVDYGKMRLKMSACKRAL